MHVLSDDTDIHYRVQGRGPDVVLLHPFPSSGEFWTPIIDRLELRFRLIVPDLRGMGDSAPGEGNATMRRYADDLRRVLDAERVGKAVFIGCSIGGYVLFEAWRQYRERFRALVLCDTKADPDDDEARKTRHRAADDVLLRGPELFLSQALPKLVGATTQRNRPDVFAAARSTCSRSSAKGIAAVQLGMAERPDSTRTLGEIDVPTLVIAGEEDIPTPPSVMQAMAQKISGSRFEVIASAGHYAPFEKPEETVRVLRQFLDSLPRA